MIASSPFDSDQHKYSKRLGGVAQLPALLRRSCACVCKRLDSDCCARIGMGGGGGASLTECCGGGAASGGLRSRRLGAAPLGVLLLLVLVVLLSLSLLGHVRVSGARDSLIAQLQSDQDQWAAGAEGVRAKQSALLQSEAMRAAAKASSTPARQGDEETTADPAGPEAAVAASDPSLVSFSVDASVFPPLRALHANMVSIEAAARALHAQLLERQTETQAARERSATLAVALDSCHARLNASMDEAAMARELVASLQRELERLTPLLPHNQVPKAATLAAGLPQPAKDSASEAEAAESMEAEAEEASASAAKTDAEADSSAPASPSAEQKAWAEATLRQLGARRGDDATDSKTAEKPTVVAPEPELKSAPASPAVKADPVPAPVPAPAAALPPAKHWGRHHTAIQPEDPGHPSAQIHFVKELPLHEQPAHHRPPRHLDLTPPAPFPSQYLPAVAAERTATAIAALPADAAAAALVAQTRASSVRAEFSHAWAAYRQFAWGFDELHPISRSGRNSQYSMAATMIDALDTMILMGFESEYAEVREFLQRHLVFDEQEDINLFETTIRVMGGLLAAHALTHDALFLRLAEECAAAMMVAFDTPTGIPFGTVGMRSQVASNPDWSAGASTMAEVGTLQLEWAYLSRVTGNPIYAAAVDKVTARIAALNRSLYPQFISVATGALTSNVITLGARVDSIYEYFLKGHIQAAGAERGEVPLRLYKSAMRALDEQLITEVADGPSGGLMTFVAEMHGHVKHGKMDHLVCFVPGMLALGVQSGAVEGADAERHMELAKQLMRTCYEFYARQPTGLAPEIVQFKMDGAGVSASSPPAFVVDGRASHSLLRPETVESLFVMWRVTGDPIYREWGWHIFEAFRTFARVEGAGYSGLRDVRVTDRPKPKAKETAGMAQDQQGTDSADLQSNSAEAETWANWNDKMESFFLAETLKYLWLLFSPSDVLPLDEFVLNTEAHPLPIFKERPPHAEAPEERITTLKDTDDGQAQIQTQTQSHARQLAEDQRSAQHGEHSDTTQQVEGHPAQEPLSAL